MSRLVSFGLVAAVGMAVACSGPGTIRTSPPLGEALVDGFDSVRVSGVPVGWVVAETEGRGLPAAWGSVPGYRGLGIAVLRSRNFGDTCSLAIREVPVLADLSVRVRLRAVSGGVAQGGGVCWRLRDPEHYWLARWNPLERDVSLFLVTGGRRRRLASRALEAPASGGWHLFEVEVSGARVRVGFDGRRVLEHDDPRLLAAGRVALWTRADACTAFDELEIRRR